MSISGGSLLEKYFLLSNKQINQLFELKKLYTYWNPKINVISRKDLDFIEEHHFLHSLAIAKLIHFKKGTEILDVGTGGGFPGIPLAILFPEVSFTLIDSIGKKVNVAKDIINELKLENVNTQNIRAEHLSESLTFDFVVSRAVTQLVNFWPWIENRFKKKSCHDLKNGLLALKGGDLSDEIQNFGKKVTLYPIKEYFEEEYFETKLILYKKCSG
jgi:16S rRNA (guanine527-N7)-methyltransferase